MAAKKKAARKAREWNIRIYRDGQITLNQEWHYSGELVRVREVLPRKRPARRKGER